MSDNFQNIAKILQKRKDTVTGFIRAQKSAKIPVPIVNICIVYYGNGQDLFDPTCIGSHMQLCNDGKYVIVTDNFVTASAYLSIIIDSGIYEWKFKIHEPLGMIGIWKVQNEPSVNAAFTLGSPTIQGYGYCIDDNTLSTLNTGATGGYSCKSYGQFSVQSNSEIDMILNMNNLTLSYAVNGTYFGKAFDVERTEYRAAVYGYCKDTYFEIMNFTAV